MNCPKCQTTLAEPPRMWLGSDESIFDSPGPPVYECPKCKWKGTEEDLQTK